MIREIDFLSKIAADGFKPSPAWGLVTSFVMNRIW